MVLLQGPSGGLFLLRGAPLHVSQARRKTLNPTPFTLHSTLYTTPYKLHPTPYTTPHLHPVFASTIALTSQAHATLRPYPRYIRGGSTGAIATTCRGTSFIRNRPPS